MNAASGQSEITNELILYAVSRLRDNFSEEDVFRDLSARGISEQSCALVVSAAVVHLRWLLENERTGRWE